nr:hypothetical protein [Tanacetum cinerariifolium]
VVREILQLNDTEVRDIATEAEAQVPAQGDDVHEHVAEEVATDVKMNAEYAKKLQEELDKEHEEAYKQIDWNAALNHVQSKEPQTLKVTRWNSLRERHMIKFFQSFKPAPAQKAAKRRRLCEQAKEDENLKKQLEVVVDEDDDVFIEATPIGTKVPVVNYEIVLINNKPSFTTLLKNFDREDLETLWRIVKDRFPIKKPTNFSDEYLLLTLKTMFGELDEQDAIWRNQKSVHGLALVKRWKLLTSCGVHAKVKAVQDAATVAHAK